LGQRKRNLGLRLRLRDGFIDCPPPKRRILLRDLGDPVKIFGSGAQLHRLPASEAAHPAARPGRSGKNFR